MQKFIRSFLLNTGWFFVRAWLVVSIICGIHLWYYGKWDLFNVVMYGFGGALGTVFIIALAETPGLMYAEKNSLHHWLKK